MIQKQVIVEVRDVYGAPNVYPINDEAKAFAAIAGTKTLTFAVLAQIKALGFQIVEAQKSRLAGVVS